MLVENPLDPGRYRFSLVVVDSADNESVPFELVVTVVARTRPVIRPDLEIEREPILRKPIAIDRARLIRPK